MACQLTFPEAQPRHLEGASTLSPCPARPSLPTCDSSQQGPAPTQATGRVSWLPERAGRHPGSACSGPRAERGTTFSGIQDSRRAALGRSGQRRTLCTHVGVHLGARRPWVSLSWCLRSSPPEPGADSSSMPRGEPPTLHSRGSSHPRGTQRDHGLAEPSQGWKLASLGERLIER